MKPLFVITLVLCLPIYIIAQRMYRCGYLVDRFGDTLSGQISFDHWKDPRQILYKKPGQEWVRYSLYEVRCIVFSGGDTYTRIIDDGAPKILHTLVDGARVQLYEQIGGDRYFYLGYGQSFQPAVVDPAAFKPLPKRINESCYSYAFLHCNPRLSTIPLVDTFHLAGKFYSTAWLTQLARSLNGNAPVRTFSEFRPRTRFVPFIGAGIAKAIMCGGPDKNFLSVLQFSNEQTKYLEGGVDIYNNWFFSGFKLRLAASYIPPITLTGQSKVDPDRATIYFNTRQTMFTVGTALLYGHSIARFLPYAYFGISGKLQVLHYSRPSLYALSEGHVTDYSEELQYYRAGLSTGLKAGLFVLPAGRYEVAGFYDWGFAFANSNHDRYSMNRNTAGLGLNFHFGRVDRAKE